MNWTGFAPRCRLGHDLHYRIGQDLHYHFNTIYTTDSDTICTNDSDTICTNDSDTICTKVKWERLLGLFLKLGHRRRRVSALTLQIYNPLR